MINTEINPKLAEIINISLENAIKNKQQLTATEFLLCSDEMKKSYINNGKMLSVAELMLSSEDII